MKPEELKKNQLIKDVITTLYETLGQDYFDIVDHWGNDEASIGIASPANNQILVYISSFNQEQGFYDVHLELPPTDKSDHPFTDAGKFNSVDFDKLLELIRGHLQ